MLTILIAVVWKKKWTSKKQVDGDCVVYDCVVYDCARSSIVDKRLQNAKKKVNGFFYSTISSENQFTSNPLKQTERTMQLNVIKNMNGGGAIGNSKENSN